MHKRFNFLPKQTCFTPKTHLPLRFSVVFNPNSKYIRTGIRLNENKSKKRRRNVIYTEDFSQTQLNKQRYGDGIKVGNFFTKSYRTKIHVEM